MMSALLCNIADGIATVTLNRPERLNAFDAELGTAFDQTMVALDQDPDVWVVILTGAGRGFCAGADGGQLDKLAKRPDALNARPPGAALALFDSLVDAPIELRSRFLLPAALSKPVIAAINGPCLGVGFALACYCDIRFMADGAFCAAAFSRRGLVAESGLAWLLPRLIGSGAAADLLISGRRVHADEAEKIGLVAAVTEPEALMDRARAYAKDLVENVSPRSMRIIKRQLHQAQGQTLREALEVSHAELQASLRSLDFREGIAAARERRRPRFDGNQA